MSKLMQYVGIVVILLGVFILGLYYFQVITGNGVLMTAAIVMVLGLIGHIILNKIFLED
jgi:hypothetical protein